jgi:hypothetical protein
MARSTSLDEPRGLIPHDKDEKYKKFTEEELHELALRINHYHIKPSDNVAGLDLDEKNGGYSWSDFSKEQRHSNLGCPYKNQQHGVDFLKFPEAIVQTEFKPDVKTWVVLLFCTSQHLLNGQPGLKQIKHATEKKSKPPIIYRFHAARKNEARGLMVQWCKYIIYSMVVYGPRYGYSSVTEDKVWEWITLLHDYDESETADMKENKSGEENKLEQYVALVRYVGTQVFEVNWAFANRLERLKTTVNRAEGEPPIPNFTERTIFIQNKIRETMMKNNFEPLLRKAMVHVGRVPERDMYKLKIPRENKDLENKLRATMADPKWWENTVDYFRWKSAQEIEDEKKDEKKEGKQRERKRPASDTKEEKNLGATLAKHAEFFQVLRDEYGFGDQDIKFIREFKKGQALIDPLINIFDNDVRQAATFIDNLLMAVQVSRTRERQSRITQLERTIRMYNNTHKLTWEHERARREEKKEEKKQPDNPFIDPNILPDQPRPVDIKAADIRAQLQFANPINRPATPPRSPVNKPSSPQQSPSSPTGSQQGSPRGAPASPGGGQWVVNNPPNSPPRLNLTEDKKGEEDKEQKYKGMAGWTRDTLFVYKDFDYSDFMSDDKEYLKHIESVFNFPKLAFYLQHSTAYDPDTIKRGILRAWGEKSQDDLGVTANEAIRNIKDILDEKKQEKKKQKRKSPDKPQDEKSNKKNRLASLLSTWQLRVPKQGTQIINPVPSRTFFDRLGGATSNTSPVNTNWADALAGITAAQAQPVIVIPPAQPVQPPQPIGWRNLNNQPFMNTGQQQPPVIIIPPIVAGGGGGGPPSPPPPPPPPPKSPKDKKQKEVKNTGRNQRPQVVPPAEMRIPQECEEYIDPIRKLACSEDPRIIGIRQLIGCDDNKQPRT